MRIEKFCATENTLPFGQTARRTASGLTARNPRTTRTSGHSPLGDLVQRFAPSRNLGVRGFGGSGVRRFGYIAADLRFGQQLTRLSADTRIAQNTQGKRRSPLVKAYVVRELVPRPKGVNEFLTQYEYGTLRIYDEANECAIATKNPRCFPQREPVPVFKGKATLVH